MGLILGGLNASCRWYGFSSTKPCFLPALHAGSPHSRRADSHLLQVIHWLGISASNNHTSKDPIYPFKALTYQTDIKERAVTVAVASRLLFLSHKAALEHTTETTADGQGACSLCSRVKRKNTQYTRRRCWLSSILHSEEMSDERLQMALTRTQRKPTVIKW